MNWTARGTDQGSEVTPVDDVIGHEEGDDCPCLPRVEHIPTVEGDRWMVVHNAWDGRQ
jgi:hypothetical protein